MKTIFKQLAVVCAMFVSLTVVGQTTANDFVELGAELQEIGAYDQAVNCYACAADKGSIEAYYKLGVCYINGYGVDTDDEYGLMLVLYSAENGYTVAQMYCAMICHEDGDYEGAVDWLSMAVENGDADAQFILGLYYVQGLGVETDYDKGLDLIIAAAENGNEDAMEMIYDLCSK